MGDMDRRDFFRSALQAAGRGVQTLVDNKIAPVPDDSVDFASDLTPELLALEAQKAGLDPVRDRDQILKRMQAALMPPPS